MNPEFLFCPLACLLFVVLPLAGLVWASSAAYQKRIAAYAPLFEALREFAEARKFEVTQTALRTDVACTVSGLACTVTLGPDSSHDSTGLELSLGVSSPRLTEADFEACWKRRWVRFRKPGDSQITAYDTSVGFMMRGPSSSFRDIFSEVDSSDMAVLFGAPPKGPGGGSRRVGMAVDHLGVSLTEPGLPGLSRLDAQLEALVKLARYTMRPFGAPQEEAVSLVAPRAAGTVKVEIQPEQRCAFCREAFAGASAQELKTCAACGSTLHGACLDEHGGCCTVGCRNNPRGRASARRRPERG